MQHLTQARSKNTKTGEPILVPLNVMAERKVSIRKGQLTLVAAGPGTGKSALVQSIVQRGNNNNAKNKVFYFSADSTSWDIYTRAAAIATNRTLDSIEEEITNSGVGRIDPIVTAATSHMMMDFTSDPSAEYVEGQLKAFLELYGEYPEVIVMDNLKNLEVWAAEDEFRALEEACIFLHDLAAKTGAAVIALHHVTGQLEDGYSQIPLSGIRGKVSKTPAMVLTLWKRMHPGTEQVMLNVSVVKNRGGSADASGNLFVTLKTDLSRMQFE